MRKPRFLSVLTFIIASAGILLYSGCSNNVSPQNSNFSLSFKTNSKNASLAKVASDSLTITNAKILIKDLKLRGSFVDSTNNNDMNDDEQNDEVEFKAGPFVISLDMTTNNNTIIVDNVPPGTYYGVKFQLHKLGENDLVTDSDFVNVKNPDDGYSVIVTGMYNGQPFTYKSDITANQKVNFQNPVTVSKDKMINVSFVIDPNSWFSLNGKIIDPTNPVNAHEINMLIRKSFGNDKCFEDDGGGSWDNGHSHGHGEGND